MGSLTTLHIGRPCHLMHSLGPRRTLPLHPPCSRAVWLCQAAPCAVVQVLRMCGRHPPAHRLSPLPSFLSGYGGAAPVAFLLQLPQPQLSCSNGCGCNPAAVVMQQHFSCRFRTAGAAAAVLMLYSCSFQAACAAAARLLPHVGCSSPQPTPAPLPMQGLRGAAAVMLQWLRQVSCCCCHAAALQLMLPRSRRSRRSAAAACRLQLTAANPRPATYAGAMGVLHEPSCRCRCSCSSMQSFSAAAVTLHTACGPLLAAVDRPPGGCHAELEVVEGVPWRSGGGGRVAWVHSSAVTCPHFILGWPSALGQGGGPNRWLPHIVPSH